MGGKFSNTLVFELTGRSSASLLLLLGFVTLRSDPLNDRATPVAGESATSAQIDPPQPARGQSQPGRQTDVALLRNTVLSASSRSLLIICPRQDAKSEKCFRLLVIAAFLTGACRRRSAAAAAADCFSSFHRRFRFCFFDSVISRCDFSLGKRPVIISRLEAGGMRAEGLEAGGDRD